MALYPARILIIDDEFSIRMSHGMYFKELGHEVVLAESAEAAFDSLKEWTPDVAIVDYRLPGIQGMDFIRKAHGLYPSILYLLYTGDSGMEIPVDLKAWGFTYNHILEKPCMDLESMRLGILKLLEEKK